MTRFLTTLALVAVFAFLLGRAIDIEQANGQPAVQAASQGLVYPRKRPLAEMSLPQVERLQVRILAHYRGALAAHEKAAARRALNRVERTHRRWYAAATIWTKAELAETRARLTVLQADRDWWFAVRYADRIYPGSAGWLLSCSASEGGHGGWVPNRQGSGAGGWMQFLSGTFYANVDAAFADARARGHVVPRSWRSWYSAGGQAVVGAYMLRVGQRGQWVGAGC
ncbi:MAG TPA: hypothetical protein VNI55_02230 [Gaiellaceae bacterium]|nr:hypothetical protein [Gaiellaceae bacterium]